MGTENAEIENYLLLLTTQHRVVYIDCDKGTTRERDLLQRMQVQWKSYSWQLKKFLNQIRKAAEEGLAHPPEVHEYVKEVAGSIAHSRTVIRRRTEEMIARRSEGIRPRDDPHDPNLHLYTVHENVRRYDLNYKDVDPDYFDGMHVKIPLPIRDPIGRIPEVEFVWAWCEGVLDEELRGTIYAEPIWASGFSQGDVVSFTADEIHDVHSHALQPTDTLSINHAEGLECLMYFCKDLYLGAAEATPQQTWFAMSDREKLHIVNFCKALRDEDSRAEERRKKP